MPLLFVVIGKFLLSVWEVLSTEDVSRSMVDVEDGHRRE
jgi:hypothetical protein